MPHFKPGSCRLDTCALQPNHFESLKELEHAMLDFITPYNQTAEPLKWSYTVQQLEHKLEPRLRREEGKSASA